MSIKRIIGALLIVYGLLAGAYAATMDLSGGRAAQPTPVEQLAQAVGGLFGGALFFVPGILLVLSGRSSPKRKQREKRDEEESGPIRFPCPECGTWLRTARQKAGGEVRCPECEQQARVPARSVPRPPSTAPASGAEGQTEAEPGAAPDPATSFVLHSPLRVV